MSWQPMKKHAAYSVQCGDLNIYREHVKAVNWIGLAYKGAALLRDSAVQLRV